MRPVKRTPRLRSGRCAPLTGRGAGLVTANREMGVGWYAESLISRRIALPSSDERKRTCFLRLGRFPVLVHQPFMLAGVFSPRNSRGSNPMKMLKFALTACVIFALPPAAACAADFGPYPPRPYVEGPVPPPPAYYARPYYPEPYFYGAYFYRPRFWRPFPYYSAYPYWRGPRFAHYGRPYWGGAWRGHGRRW
jgi:hypothetical protein